ncbi:MAG: dTDP-4-dehydrorhamnose reductase [Bacteroidales bacterium]|nr:dTDP-4-dehydrorhamnose reductase [Bacteroidales bacterium]
MKIAVLGAKGQLGRKINDLSALYTQHSFVFADIDELDITKQAEVEQFVAAQQPDVIINCAAYTAVDKAETDYDKAKLLNAVAVGYLANAAKQHNVFFVHVSTDYVFDGTNCRPYLPTDAPNPVSVYGATKLEGEKLFIASQCRGAIVRTSWLYSEYGNNFVKTMLRLGKEKPSLNVVCDQIGTPTYAGDLADAILQITMNNQQIKQQEIFHFSNNGVASWYDFAHTIMEMAALPCQVMPIRSSEYPTPAQRPFYSVFDKVKIAQMFQIAIPYWKDSLKVCIEKLQMHS